MRKIYKTFGYDFEKGEPVKIDNTVFVSSELARENYGDTAQDIIEREKNSFENSVRAEAQRLNEENAAENQRQKELIINAAQKNAAVIISDAKKNTAEIIEKTRAECEMLKERAKKEGFDEGLIQGKKDALDKCKKYIDAAASLISEINARKEAYFLSNEQELKDTLIAMVEKLTKAEIKADKEVIARIIADAAKSFRNSDYLKISLAEGEISREFKSDNKLIKQLIPYIKDIDIEILPEAEEGTVILDDDETIVDASVPTQLDFLREILDNTRSRNDNPIDKEDA